MPQLPSTSFSYITIFDKNSSPKKVIIRDTTDWTTIGIDPNNAFVYLKVSYTAANGTTTVFYDNFNNATGNGPDLNRSLGTDSTSIIPLPLQVDGNISFGSFLIEAQYNYLDTFGNDYITEKSYGYDYTWVPPCVEIMQRINLSSSNITTTDVTNYGNYLSLSRVHTISPPANAMLPPLSMPVGITTQAINVYQDIATGTWSAKVVSVVTYLLTASQTPLIDGLEVIEQLIGCIEFEVVSDIDINALFCCLGNLKTQFERLQLSNARKAKLMWDTQIAPLELNLTYYLIVMAGGCMDRAATTLVKIKEISGCENCECGGDECPTPIPVITGAGNFYNVDSPNGSILVVPEVIGNTTTFHITVNPAIIPTVVLYQAVGSDPISVATTNPSPGVTLFTISTTRPIPYVENSSVIRVTLSKIVNVWTIAMESIFIDTSLGIVDVFANHTIAFANGNAQTDFAAFFYADFFTSDQKFVAQANTINSYYNEDETTVIPFISDLDVIEANVMWIENATGAAGNKCLIRLYNPITSKILKISDLERTGRDLFQIHLKVQAITV